MITETIVVCEDRNLCLKIPDRQDRQTRQTDKTDKTDRQTRQTDKTDRQANFSFLGVRGLIPDH